MYSDAGRVIATRDRLKSVLNHFANALLQGTKHTYEILPRLITLWLDLGDEVARFVERRA